MNKRTHEDKRGQKRTKIKKIKKHEIVQKNMKNDKKRTIKTVLNKKGQMRTQNYAKGS